MSARTLYAVLTDGEDCWTISDEAGVQRPHRFASFDAAQEELNTHMREMEEDGVDYDPAEFRIVEIDAPAHTPGPWHVKWDFEPSDFPENGLLIKAAPGQVVAECDRVPEMEANAQLIAAAPELLEALRWALDQIDDSLDPDHCEALAAAHRAIAKATGGPR